MICETRQESRFLMVFHVHCTDILMIKKKVQKKKDVVIYQAKSGAIELKGDFSHETIWATQAQIANLFDVTPQNVTLHINNIFKDKELDAKSTCKDSLQVQTEGTRTVERTVKLYNLDTIIAVGYRISSVTGTNFRIWATKTLKGYVIDGYAINKKRIGQNYEQFLNVVQDIHCFAKATQCRHYMFLAYKISLNM